MEKQRQIDALWSQCQSLEADMRYGPLRESFTVLIPPPWDTETETTARALQGKIKAWSKQYPDIICYCFDSFSTMFYVL